MSLAVLADHMATKGRHGDDMLVHMSKDEVAALQQLAEAHGLTLTINPETGLPEAFSLKSLLKAVAPVALGWFLGPAGASFGGGLFSSSLGASLAVGGIGALATGSLEKGLQMGLSAYGGAELGQSLVKAGASATPVASAVEAAGAGATVSPELGRQLSQSQMAFLEANAPEFAAAQQAVQAAPTVLPDVAYSAPTLQQSQANLFSQLPFSDKLSAMYQGVANAPGEFVKKNLMPIGMAASSLLTANQPKLAGVGETDPSKVYFPRKRYNPYTGMYEQLPGFTLQQYREGIMSGRSPMNVADGGIVALAGGGITPSYQRTSMSPGMLDFVDRSEPVVRMADGGATREQVLQAYANTAGAVTNPDEEAINYWMGQGLGGFANAVSGARAGMTGAQTSAIDAARAANQGVLNQGMFNQMLAAAPAAAPVAQNVTTQTTTTAPTQAQLNDITNIYRNVLGRDPDAVGLNYWAGRLAAGESLDSVYAALQGSARTVLGANANTLAPGLGKTLADATKAPTTYVSSQGNTIADEWIRNILGREPTAADKAQGWYQNLDKLGTQADVSKAYADFLAYAGKSATGQPDWFTASQLKKPTGTTSPTITGGGGNDVIRVEQPPGTGTPPIAPVIPGAGPVPTMTQVRNAYTQGGGNIYAPRYPKKYKGTSGTAGSVDLITQGYQDFWANTPVGSEISWAGGKLKRTGGGQAVFTGPDGQTYSLSPGSDLNNIAANNPYIAETWRKEFGFIPTNYVTGATLKGYNYLMGQGEYPVSQTPAGGIMKPYWESVGQKQTYTPKPLTGTDGGTTIDTSGINPNAPAGMQKAFDDWWTNNPVGTAPTSWAGGTLTRTAAGTAVFKYKDADGKEQQMVIAPTSRFEDLVANPLIANYWKNEFQYDVNKHKNNPPAPPPEQGGAATGGLLALARGGMARYAEGGASGHYEWRDGEQGEYIWVEDPTPTPAPPPVVTETAPVDSGIAALQQQQQQQNAALAQAGYNPQTDTVAPTTTTTTTTTAPTAEDYARSRFQTMFGREGTPEEIAATAQNIIVDPTKNYATYRYTTPFGAVDTEVFRTPMETAKVVDASQFPGAAADQALPHMYRNEGQVLGKDGNMYKVMEHGELIQQKLTPDMRDYMTQKAAQDEAKFGPWERGAMTAGPVNWSLSDYVNKPAVAAPVAPMTQAQQQALAQQIVQLGYDPTGRYDPAVMAIVAKLKGTGMAGGGISQLGILGAAARGGQFNLGDYSDGGRLLKGPGDGVSDSIPASIGGKRPARLADGEFVVPARIVSELGNGSTDAGARKLYAMMDRIQARRGKTTGKGKVAVNSRADKYLPA